uniref:Uncharacterized protein n=1 Tax=Meloidogyne enterolobii TaxID=390850 RepID=A0A6V7UFQ8_MELEN|nr:unnamed protein product [Meloidogyne enterolobii]
MGFPPTPNAASFHLLNNLDDHSSTYFINLLWVKEGRRRWWWRCFKKVCSS